MNVLPQKIGKSRKMVGHAWLKLLILPSLLDWSKESAVFVIRRFLMCLDSQLYLLILDSREEHSANHNEYVKKAFEMWQAVVENAI